MKSKTRVKNTPTKALKRLQKLGDSLKGPNLVKVGLPKGSNDYPDGTSLIMVGSVHEFGSPLRGVPQRSYLRSTISEGKKKYRGVFKKLAEKITRGQMSKEQALETLGLLVTTDVKDKITDIKAPPLTSRDGNPLVDTGHLRQSITYEVDK